MSKNLTVRKDNVLVNASYSLSLVEQRLLLLAIAESAGDAESLRRVTVHAATYAEAYGMSRQAAYMALSEAATQLFKRQFSYERTTKKGTHVKGLSRWVQNVEYFETEAKVEVAFADKVIPFLSELKSRFTWYPLEEVADLTSVYAIRLYELLIAWRSTGKTPIFELTEFREKLGIALNEYPRMTDFKKWVLDLAVGQITVRTDLQVTYTQHKEGRTISGFSFEVSKKKPAKTVKTAKITDSTAKITDKPANTSKQPAPAIAPKILTRAQADKLARIGETYAELDARLRLMGYLVKG